MDKFELNLGDKLAYDGLKKHGIGSVVGIDRYSRVVDGGVAKRWTSYTISQDTELPVEQQMREGHRWWVTSDGEQIREWVFAEPSEIDESGEKVESLSGTISVEFEGDCGLSTSDGKLFVYQYPSDDSIWHARETFFSDAGEEVICFHSKKILSSLSDIKQ